MSLWAVIILVATIITLVMLVLSIVLTATGVPAALEVAKQAAIDGGASQTEADLAASIAVGVIIVALVFGSIFDVLKIIGGFMFSLKGRWGMFCIVVSIISVVFDTWGLISDISNKAAVANIVTSVVSLLVSMLLCVACLEHRKELRNA